MIVAERRRRRRSPLRRLVPVLLAVVLFALGVAVGQALDDNPEPGGTQTLERTLLPPTTLAPPPKTVTVRP